MFGETIERVRNLPGIYHLRRERYRRLFFSGNGRRWLLWGSYASVEDARGAVMDPRATGYDSEQMVNVDVEWASRISLFDYPVMHWISRILREENTRSLVDFGGHIGVKYYAYRKLLQIPPDFVWQVVDVPAMVNRGREKALQESAEQLRFLTNVADAVEANLLFCSGSLQYVSLTMDEIVQRMVRSPEYIIINRLGVLPDSEVISLENFGTAWLPYRIQNLKAFNARMARLGYRQVDAWEIEGRSYSVPFVDAAQNIKTIGQVWHAAPST